MGVPHIPSQPPRAERLIANERLAAATARRATKQKKTTVKMAKKYYYLVSKNSIGTKREGMVRRIRKENSHGGTRTYGLPVYDVEQGQNDIKGLTSSQR